MDPKFIEWLNARGFDPKSISEKQAETLRAVFISETAPKTEPPKVDTEAIERAAAEKAKKAEIERGLEIRSACTVFGCEDQADELIRAGLTLDQARAKIQDFLKAKPRPQIGVAPVVSMGQEDVEKFRAAAVDGMMSRAGMVLKNPAPGHENFRGMTPLRLAEKCLIRAGIKTDQMDSMQIASAALGIRGAYPIVGTTADFTHILVDAQNKSMQKGFNEADRIWNLIARPTSVPDFKTIYRPQLSEAADLDEIGEAGEYTEMKFNDSYESYAVAPYGRKFTVTRKAIINDDAGAFTTIPAKLGAAAQRKIDQLLISVLTTNANMHDGNALFSAAHLNYTSGADTHLTHDGVFAAAIAAMRKQKGSGEDSAYLNIMPKFILVPAALDWDAKVLLGDVNPSTSVAAGSLNPAKSYMLQVISCGLLDASSLLAWYLLADPSANDTLEVAFLNGVQAPVIEETEQMDVDGRIYKVRLDVGVKALDWRGMYKSKGEA